MSVPVLPKLPFDFTMGESANKVSIAPEQLNALYRDEYMDDYGFYQSLYNLFGTMKLNTLQKFETTRLKGLAGVWNELNGCTMTETGVIVKDTRSITPVPMYNLTTFCPVDEVNALFKTLIEWKTNGMADLTDAGARALNIYLKEFMSLMTESLRNTFTLNKLFDFTTVTYAAGVNATLQNQLTNSANSLVGWLALLDQLYTSDTTAYYNLNYNKATFVTAPDFTNGEFTGTVKTKVQELKDAAPKRLKSLINSGGRIASNGKVFQAVIAMSNSYFGKVVKEYEAEKGALATNAMSWTKEDRTAAGMTKAVYFLDGIPVVPVESINGLDEHLDSDTHFLGIVATQNIQFGTSFANIPTNIESDPIALQVIRSNELAPMGTVNNMQTWEQGRIKQLSHAIGATAIADTDYIICHIAIT